MTINQQDELANRHELNFAKLFFASVLNNLNNTSLGAQLHLIISLWLYYIPNVSKMLLMGNNEAND